ncbi:MAG TPA: S8 family serine peptidase [Rhodothermales bacterium]|nr:S8 family serine peptidase [Rhodothermales bacterium]
MSLVSSINPASAQVAGPEFGPGLLAQLSSLTPADEVEVIVTFEGRTVSPEQLAAVQALGITRGVAFDALPIMGVLATRTQVEQLARVPGVRSLWRNEPLQLDNDDATALTGAKRLRGDSNLTARNGGLPVTGKGIGVLINDSGVDGLHGDLPFGPHVVQNVTAQTNLRARSSLLPVTYVENSPMTDVGAGHGSHVAGIVAGTGAVSKGKYEGVAPGAHIIGYGSGVGLNIFDTLGGFNYAIKNRDRYNIRVINNSFGNTSDVKTNFNPNDPTNVASKIANDLGIVVVFSTGNSGPGEGTITGNFKKAPWVVAVANGLKDGRVASSSSRGVKGKGGTATIGGQTYTWEDRPTVMAPGTDIISVRSSTNTNSTLPDDDLNAIETEYVPYYTVLSGTSMAAPHVAGVVALMLEANPGLTTAEVKQILQDTATNVPGREPWEVGAGYVNAYAAVDRAAEKRAYGSTVNMTRSFNSHVTLDVRSTAFNVEYNTLPEASPTQNQYAFDVPEGVADLEVKITAGGVLGQTGNTINLVLIAPGGTEYGSGVPTTTFATTGKDRVVSVIVPHPGRWVVELRGLRGAADNPTDGAAAPQAVPGTVKLVNVVSANGLSDIAGHPAEVAIKLAVAKRLMDGYSDRSFRPDRHFKRIELADSLVAGTAVRQFLPTNFTPTFADVYGDEAVLAEAVAARGASLRDTFHAQRGVILPTAPGQFSPSQPVRRVDLAYALVQSLGLEREALALNGTAITVEHNGTRVPLSDASQIPAGMEGYVQLALDLNIMQATVSQDGGAASFSPSKLVTRGEFATSVLQFFSGFLGGF